MRTIILSLAILVAFTGIAHADNPRELWIYYATNLQVDKNVDELEKIWKRAAAAGYTRVLLTDSKMARLGDLGDMTKRYMSNVARAKKIAADLKMQIVPAVFPIGYSNSLLWHDPNLAEGLPVKDALFVVHNGEARLQADPPVSIQFPGWKDDSVHVNGNVATVRDNVGNARMVFKLKLPRFRCYHVSVQVRTQDYRANPEIKALAGKVSLQYQSLAVKPTQDWKQYDVVFNTLDNTEIGLYFGVWSASKGTLEWKDWKIEEAGLVNVLRRPGAPVVVKGYVEGKDYEVIVDPKLGNHPWNGEYEAWHEAPVIKTKLPEDTALRVSWYHPAIIYDGQVSCCPSEPKTVQLLADEANRVMAAFGSHGYMMHHDEIRTLNWCDACQRRKLSAGQILADNARQCTRLLGGNDIYVWSDMFDPHHNARADYYLVRGDLAGSWEGLDKRVIIMNWNFGQRDKSLKFFADRGHRQVIAGYYDGPVEKVRDWLTSASKVPNVVGVMYTTWNHNYRDLEAFAKACAP